jgi:hypothetical protein
VIQSHQTSNQLFEFKYGIELRGRMGTSTTESKSHWLLADGVFVCFSPLVQQAFFGFLNDRELVIFRLLMNEFEFQMYRHLPLQQHHHVVDRWLYIIMLYVIGVLKTREKRG